MICSIIGCFFCPDQSVPTINSEQSSPFLPRSDNCRHPSWLAGERKRLTTLDTGINHSLIITSRTVHCLTFRSWAVWWQTSWLLLTCPSSLIMSDTKVCLQINHVINSLTLMDAVNLEGLQPVQWTAIHMMLNFHWWEKSMWNLLSPQKGFNDDQNCQGRNGNGGGLGVE